MQIPVLINTMEVKPAVPDGRHEIVLANWPDNKHVTCNDNTAFMHYFDSLTDKLDVNILQNWTTHEKILPISLQTSEFDS